MQRRAFVLGIVGGIAMAFLAIPARALDPSLRIISPAPGEVVESNTVNAIIETDVGLASSPTAPGYIVQLWLDTPSADPSRAITTHQRGYIFDYVPAGLHTLRVAISGREANGVITKYTESSVDFEVAPPPTLPVVGAVSWYSLLRDGIIFSFPIIALALLFLWMHLIIRRGRL